jgi:GR25 family glycosyltransferase involved in LPS biosynthesis
MSWLHEYLQGVAQFRNFLSPVFSRYTSRSACLLSSPTDQCHATGIGTGREPEIVNMNKLSEIVRYGNHADLLNSDFSRDIETLGKEFAQPIDPNHIHNYRDRYCLFIELIRFTEGLDAAIKRIDQDLADGMHHRIYTYAGATAYRRENRYDEELRFLRNAYETHKLDLSVAKSYACSLLSNNFPEDAAAILLQSLDKLTSVAQAVPALVLIANTCQWNVLREGLKYVTDIVQRGDSTIAAGTLATLEERLRQSSTDKKTNIPLLSISLERDRRKRELQRRLYSFCGLQIEFLNGIPGATLPRIVETLLCPAGFLGGLSKGAIGCALSHIKAWEFMTEKSYEFAVILEDDGTPYYGFNPETLINDSGSDFDILLINQRMSSLIGPPTHYKYAGCVNVSERLHEMPDTQKGWGGDGYILSYNGAKRLLRCISVDGILGHIDGQLSSYGYDRQNVAQSRAQVAAAMVMAKSKLTDRLNVKCLNFPAVHQMNFDYSSSNEESRK